MPSNPVFTCKVRILSSVVFISSQQTSAARFVDLPARKRKVLTPEELEERRRKVGGFMFLNERFQDSISLVALGILH